MGGGRASAWKASGPPMPGMTGGYRPVRQVGAPAPESPRPWPSVSRADPVGGAWPNARFVASLTPPDPGEGPSRGARRVPAGPVRSDRAGPARIATTSAPEAFGADPDACGAGCPQSETTVDRPMPRWQAPSPCSPPVTVRSRSWSAATSIWDVSRALSVAAPDRCLPEHPAGPPPRNPARAHVRISSSPFVTGCVPLRTSDRRGRPHPSPSCRAVRTAPEARPGDGGGAGPTSCSTWPTTCVNRPTARRPSRSGWPSCGPPGRGRTRVCSRTPPPPEAARPRSPGAPRDAPADRRRPRDQPLAAGADASRPSPLFASMDRER